LRTPATNAALERTISRARLARYLAAAGHDLDTALGLYETNTRLSESFYTPLQSVEICLRNCIHEQMAARYGLDWYRNEQTPLGDVTRRLISDVVSELTKSGKNSDPGSVVAELKFAFWVGLLSPRYDTTLWRTVLHRAFRVEGGKPRSVVHGRFNAIRRFRNRVAHHEPIFDRALVQIHSEIIEAIRWMSRETANWAAYHSRFEHIWGTAGLG
jgi:hypothetical protein